MDDEQTEDLVRRAGIARVEQKLSSGNTEEILDTLKDIAATERVEHFWKDGVYQGAMVAYTNPLLPELRQMYHPYMPLMCDFKPSEHAIKRDGVWFEEPTVAYFKRHGFPVPPGA